MLRAVPECKKVEDDFAPPLEVPPAQTRSWELGTYQSESALPHLVYDCEPTASRIDLTLNVETLPTDNGLIRLMLHVGNFGALPVTVRVGVQVVRS